MIYVISDLEFDLDRRLLSRDGQPIKLTKLDFKVLRALVEASPALIRHEDLITQVWGPNRVISPENLSQRMKTLRQSLGDDPNDPTYIEGVRGQGFRLIPEVKVQSNQKSDRGSKRFWTLGLVGMLIGLLTWYVIDRMDQAESETAVSSISSTPVESPVAGQAQRPAIAVLPFANLSDDPSNQYFTDGIHDDLLTRISNIHDIKTISRTSVMTYEVTNKKLGTIAQELGVNTILEGGVQRVGNQVRINLQLIEAASDTHLWAQTYTRELTATNVFVVQAEITEAVADALQAILSQDERKQIEKRPTANLQALDAYFLGNQYFDQATTEGFEQAIAAYRTAVLFDPEFAQAYSKQALAMLHQIWNNGLPAKTQLEKSRPLINQAILLDPQSSDAFTALGKWYEIAGDIDKAEQAFSQAMVLGPNNVVVLRNYGNLKQWGRSDPVSAIELFRKAAELDPQNAGIKIQLAEIMGVLGLEEEAIPMMESLLADHADSAGGYRVLATLYSAGEFRHDKAIRALRKAYYLDPEHPGISFMNANIHWRLGDYDNASLWLNHAARLVPESEEAPVYRGWAHIAAENYQSARQEFDRTDSESILYWVGIFTLGRVDVATGRPENAIKRYMAFASRFNGKKSYLNFSYGLGAIYAYQALGEQEKAQALWNELKSIVEASPSMGFHGVQIFDASLYAMSGQSEAAIKILGDWVNQGGSSSELKRLTRYELAVLADNPEYRQLLHTVESRLSKQKENLARWEASGEMPPIPGAVKDPG
jgi:TolB-like protein/DNA-binding winged helix-turn-helix (wHTH) protein/Tfp pilus assembly protein PilF